MTFYVYWEYVGCASDAESKEDAVAEAKAVFLARLQNNEVEFLVEEEE